MSQNHAFATTSQDKEISHIQLAFCGLFVGIVAGAGAVIFRGMIGLVHNVLFLGKWSVFYNANVHTPVSPWGAGVIFVPILGALAVVWLVKNFAPEAKGHGVPEVMDAIYYQKGIIRPIVALIKSVASAISIGTGGSVGREGPIVQIGSAFGSTLGTWIKMPVRQRIILIAAGAAGGIAATFNTPVGAMAFGIELMLVSISADSLIVVGIGVVTATYIGRFFLGVYPAFYIPALIKPQFSITNPLMMVAFIPFGALIGYASMIFVKGLYWAEDTFDALPGNYYTRHLLGMAIMGVMIFAFMHFSGHYYVQGVGYATIEDVFRGTLLNPWFLLLLFFGKLLATFLTLGSGASGGIFSPSLFMGATLGGAVGAFLNQWFPAAHFSPVVFGIAGMAGMVGSATGAVLTAVMMIIEMTYDVHVVMLILITVTVAYYVRKTFSRESIYTLKILRRGQMVPEGLQAALLHSYRSEHVMDKTFVAVEKNKLKHHVASYFKRAVLGETILVTEDNNVCGMVCHKTVKNIDDLTMNDILDERFVMTSPSSMLTWVLRAMKRSKAQCVVVTAHVASSDISHVQGVIMGSKLKTAMYQLAELI